MKLRKRNGERQNFSDVRTWAPFPKFSQRLPEKEALGGTWGFGVASCLLYARENQAGENTICTRSLG